MVTKLFFSTDFVPIESDVFSICADLLDVYMDFSCMYGDDRAAKDLEKDTTQESYEVTVKLNDKKVLYLQQIVQ